MAFKAWAPGSWNESQWAAGTWARGYSLAVNSGDLHPDFTPVTLKESTKRLIASSGSFGLETDFSNLGLSVDRGGPTESGSLSLLGTGVDLKATRKMAASPGDLHPDFTSVDIQTTARCIYAASGSFSLETDFSNLGLDVARGIPAESGSFALTGTAINQPLTRKIEAASGNISLIGTDVNLRGVTRFSIDSGSFDLETDFSALNFEVVRGVSVESGSFALSGTAVNMGRTWKISLSSGDIHPDFTTVELKTTAKCLAIDPGAFDLDTDFSSVGLNITRGSASESGSFALTGTGVTFGVSRKLSVSPGDIHPDFTSVDLIGVNRLLASSGLFRLQTDFSNLDFNRSRALSADSGVFAITGIDINLVKSTEKMAAASGSFDLETDFSSLDFWLTRKMSPDSGSVSLLGTDADLVKRTHYRIAADPCFPIILSPADIDMTLRAAFRASWAKNSNIIIWREVA
jgi:hypothetical protein